VRNRSETLGSLGRAPARTSRAPINAPQAPIGEPQHDRGTIRRWLRGALFDNIGLKFLSLVLAATVFLLVNTDKVHVAFDKRIEKVVEVSAHVTGRPEHGFVVSEVKPVPATMKVRGAESTLNALSSIHTRDISFDGRAETFVAETEAVPPDGVEIEGSPGVVVHVTVEEELVTRKLPAVTVSVKGDGIDPAKWRATPAQVDITLTGTLLAVENAKAAIAPIAKITAGGEGKPREVDLSMEGLPPGIGVKVSPERVRVTPAKAGPAQPSP
jgi:YbbR domain-containing protein